MFFEGRDQVHHSMRRLVRKLEKANIPYALVGGLAVKAHGYRRTTNDVDVLLTPEGFTTFRKRFVPKDYDPVAGRRRRLVDRANGVTVDFLLTGQFPRDGRPGPIAFPDPSTTSETIEGIRILNLPALMVLKLAARRHQDFADVVNLIRAHDLDESYLTRLHPTLHGDFIECLEEKRREEDYNAREG